MMTMSSNLVLVQEDLVLCSAICLDLEAISRTLIKRRRRSSDNVIMRV